MDVRVKTEASNFNAVRSKIEGWPEEVAQNVYWPRLEEIGREGVEYMRYIILSSVTATGEERARSGGPGPGRVNTGKMYDAVKYRARRRAKGGFSLFVGWIDGRPGYSIFQEQGVKNGVIGMNALGQAQEYMLSQIKAMAAGKYQGGNTRFEGNE